MQRQGFSKTVLLIAVLLAGLAGFLIVRSVNHETPAGPELTHGAALALLKDKLPDGCPAEGIQERYRSCTLAIAKEGDHYVVSATFEGFYDDSVKASRTQVVVTRRGEIWVTGEVTETYQCWPGRGHQDFSAELCV